MPSKIEMIAGDDYGFWTVLDGVSHEINKCKQLGYHVKCRCGTIKTVSGSALRNGKTASCGCLQREKMRELCRSRRKNRTPIPHELYRRIIDMARKRNIPFDSNLTEKVLYGLFEKQKGRCELSNKRLHFAVDKYDKNTASLDRINPDIGYEIGNVQWVHKKVNRVKWKLDEVTLLEICLEVVEYQDRNSK